MSQIIRGIIIATLAVLVGIPAMASSMSDSEMCLPSEWVVSIDHTKFQNVLLKNQFVQHTQKNLAAWIKTKRQFLRTRRVPASFKEVVYNGNKLYVINLSKIKSRSDYNYARNMISHIDSLYGTKVHCNNSFKQRRRTRQQRRTINSISTVTSPNSPSPMYFVEDRFQYDLELE